MSKDFLEVVTTRKSVRSFTPVVPPRALIEEVLKTALMAPTNCNQQLWNFIVVDDPAVKERLKKETSDAIAKGVFGSPFVIVDGEPFWGSDRMWMIKHWLRAGGW